MRYLPVFGLIALLTSSLVVQRSQANSPMELSFEEQFIKSDIVVIGVSGKERRHRTKSAFGAVVEIGITDISVERVLKGNLLDHVILIVTRGDVSDLDPRCCKRGSKYILILRRGANGVFESYNGSFSAIKI